MIVNKKEIQAAIQLVEWHREYLMDIGLHPTQVKKRKLYLMTNQYNRLGIEDIKFFYNKTSMVNKQIVHRLKPFINWLERVDSVSETELRRNVKPMMILKKNNDEEEES